MTGWRSSVGIKTRQCCDFGKGTDVSSVVGEKVTGTQVCRALAEILPRTYLDGVGVTVRGGRRSMYFACLNARMWNG